MIIIRFIIIIVVIIIIIIIIIITITIISNIIILLQASLYQAFVPQHLYLRRSKEHHLPTRNNRRLMFHHRWPHTWPQKENNISPLPYPSLAGNFSPYPFQTYVQVKLGIIIFPQRFGVKQSFEQSFDTTSQITDSMPQLSFKLCAGDSSQCFLQQNYQVLRHFANKTLVQLWILKNVQKTREHIYLTTPEAKSRLKDLEDRSIEDTSCIR